MWREIVSMIFAALIVECLRRISVAPAIPFREPHVLRSIISSRTPISIPIVKQPTVKHMSTLPTVTLGPAAAAAKSATVNPDFTVARNAPISDQIKSINSLSVVLAGTANLLVAKVLGSDGPTSPTDSGLAPDAGLSEINYYLLQQLGETQEKLNSVLRAL